MKVTDLRIFDSLGPDPAFDSGWLSACDLAGIVEWGKGESCLVRKNDRAEVESLPGREVIRSIKRRRFATPLPAIWKFPTASRSRVQ